MASPLQNPKKSWFRLRYEEENEPLSETRNVLLIVVALIVTVTFQAGVNPPGGVWQNDGDKYKAGRAIYASQKEPFYVFLISNTVAFSTSILILISLTYRFPFHFEVWVATGSMIFTYASAIFAVAPDESVKFRYVMFAGCVPFAIQLVKKCVYRMMSK